LIDFKTDIGMPIFIEKLNTLEDAVNSNMDDFRANLGHGFDELLQKIKAMQAMDGKAAISCITLSILRTSLFENTFAYRLDAQDKYWFMDDAVCDSKVSAPWIFDLLDKFKGELSKIAKTYVGKVYFREIGEICNEYLLIINRYLTAWLRKNLPAVLNDEFFEGVNTEETCETRFGEYQDATEMVCLYHAKQYSNEEMMEVMKKKRKYLTHYDISNRAIINMRLDDLNLRYAKLENSDFSGCKFEASNLFGANAANTTWTDADISFSVIYGADFTGCDLSRSGCRELQGYNLYVPDGVKYPTWEPVSFKGAILEETDFSGSKLDGAVFSGASFKDTDFTGVSLYHSVFSESDSEILQLSEAQRKHIIWI